MVVTVQEITPSFDLKYLVPEERLTRLRLAGLQIYHHLAESLSFPGASRFDVFIDFNLYRNYIYIRGSLPSSKYSALYQYVETAFYRCYADSRMSRAGSLLPVTVMSLLKPYLPHYLEPMVAFSIQVEPELIETEQAFPRTVRSRTPPPPVNPAMDEAAAKARALYNEVITLRSKLPSRGTAFAFTVTEPPAFTMSDADPARFLADLDRWTRQTELTKAFIHQRLARSAPQEPKTPPAPSHARTPRRVHPAHIEHALSLLGLQPDMVIDDSNRHLLKEAWKKKLLKSHPDKGGSSTSTHAINDAKDLLIREGLYPASNRFS